MLMFDKIINEIQHRKNYYFPVLYGYGTGTKDVEFVGLIFAEQPYLGYYYAHIAKHPEKDCWVSCLIRTSRFIFGNSGNDWIQNFNYWLRIRLDYEPVSYQVAKYSYTESTSIEMATLELQNMLINFNYNAALSTELEFGNHSITEIIHFYGTGDFKDENGMYPDPPGNIGTIFH